MPEPKPKMRDEYDFASGVRGKYAADFKDGSNIIVLEPDIARKFKTSEDVNEALRKLAANEAQEANNSR